MARDDRAKHDVKTFSKTLGHRTNNCDCGIELGLFGLNAFIIAEKLVRPSFDEIIRDTFANSDTNDTEKVRSI